MTRERYIGPGLLMLGLLIAGPVMAEWHPHGEIRAAAEAFVNQRIGETAEVEAAASRVDSRLRLRQCEQALEAWLPAGRRLEGDSTTIGVRCPGPVQWRVFVPVSIQVFAPVLVSQGVLQRGQILGPGDVALERRNTSSLRRDYFTRPEEVLGTRLRRNLSPGVVLQPNHVAIRRLVERGQRLQLIAGNDSVQISMAGRALEDGARGQRIRVENLSSGKELQGVVTGEGRVEIRY